MKLKHFAVLFIMLFTLGAVAQETVEATVELEPSFNALVSFFLPAVGGILLGLFADASKHIKSGTWNTGTFIGTKLKPFLITVVLAVAIYYILIYVPFLEPYLEVLAEEELAEVTAFFLIGYAGTIIDGFTKKKEATVEE